MQGAKLQGAKCKVQSCKVQGAKCKVQSAKLQGARCKVQGARCKVQGARVQGARCMVQGARCKQIIIPTHTQKQLWLCTKPSSIFGIASSALCSTTGLEMPITRARTPAREMPSLKPLRGQRGRHQRMKETKTNSGKHSRRVADNPPAKQALLKERTFQFQRAPGNIQKGIRNTGFASKKTHDSHTLMHC